MANVRILDLQPLANGISGQQQLSLFAAAEDSACKYAFVDVAALNQLALFQILVRNAVKCVVDIRQIPLFSKPKYNHKEVVAYFYNSGVDYIEWSYLEKFEGALPKPERGHEKKIPNGFTLCLYDVRCERDKITKVRSYFRKIPRFTTEVHPNALPGLR